MKKSFLSRWMIAGMFVLFLAACGGAASGSMVVEEAWVRAAGGMGAQDAKTQTGPGGMETPAAMEGDTMMTGMNSAAYMLIRNGTGVADRLVRVESDVAQAIELHQTQVENEVMTMRPVESIDLPIGGQTALEPGGLHIMLIGLKQPLAAGQRVTLTLVFETAPPLTVEAEVRAP
jgi:copper(I)-binding protein